MDWWNRAKTFMTETKAEMSKATFPSRDEVVSTTAVVLVASFIFAVFLWLSDLVIVQVREAIFGFFA